MNARGMPSVELSNQTKEKIELEAEEAKPKPNLEIFDSPKLKEGAPPSETPSDNIELKVESEVASEAVVKPKKPVKKPKRKLTDKQLEALKKGREKSIETRRKNKKEKEVKKAEQVLQTTSEVHQSAPVAPPPQVVQVTPVHQPAQIDYDKIINGVVGKMETMNTQRANREHLVAENVNAFEEKIRDDERNNVLKQIEDMQKQEDIAKSSHLAHKYLTKPKPVVNNNPYAYALQMGANSRYRRY